MIEFTIPGIPAKHVETRFANGHAYSPCTKAKQDLKNKMLLYAPETPSEGPIILEATYFMPTPKSFSKKKKQMFTEYEKSGDPVEHTKKPDTCAMNKILKDAMEGIFYKNDSQVFDEHFRKVYGQEPRTEVRTIEYQCTT